MGFKYPSYYDTSDGDIIYFPFLEELIEACGKDFNFVCRNKDTGQFGAETFSGIVITKCKTSDEAVANLWLALNKN